MYITLNNKCSNHFRKKSPDDWFVQIYDSKEDFITDVMTHEVGHCIGMADWRWVNVVARLGRTTSDFMENSGAHDGEHFSDASWLGVWTKSYEDFVYKDQYTEKQYEYISYGGWALWDKASVDEVV